MINPKYICISAGVGFCLSFFIGLISDVRFSHVCLRAFFFALVFAFLCVGISFLYKKFLSSDTGLPNDSEYSPAHPSSGGIVNIVVDDSNLADDEHAPHFEISNSSQNKSFGGDLENEKNEKNEPNEQLDDIGKPAQAKTSSEQAKIEEVQEFKPANIGALTSSSSDSANVEPASSKMEQSAPDSAAVENESQAPANANPASGIDELPDIGDMNLSSAAGDSMNSTINSGDEVISDSEFASGGGSFKETTTQDTDVMAKAIQTILAKDND